MDFLRANEPFGISALVITLGYLLKKLGVLQVKDGETLARVALNITLPALILLNVPQVSLTGSNAFLPLCSLLSSTITVAVGLWFFRKQSRTDRGLSLTASSGYNIGLFAMPLVAGVYGAEGIARFALLDMGNVISVFLISYYMAFHHSPLRESSGRRLKEIAGMFLRSIPILAYILAITMNIAGWRFSGFSESFLGVFSAMNRGVALLTLGVLLRFSFPSETWKAILPPLFLRYIFGVAAAAMALFFLPMPLENRIAVASVMVMPMGLTLIPFAVKWGYERDRAAAIINMGIPVSFVLFWIIWAVGRYMGR